MKASELLKNLGRKLYTLGLKLIFIYAEYCGPTLFASLMNLCISKIKQLLRAYQNNLQLAGTSGCVLFKIIRFSQIIGKAQNGPRQFIFANQNLYFGKSFILKPLIRVTRLPGTNCRPTSERDANQP